MQSCRVVIDEPRGGSWNMALDEVLLDRVASDGRYQLRLYSWAEPTISLGYFQSATERESHRPSSACPLVRRPSGGGALVHDREVTYALAAPKLRDARQAQRLYKLVHEAVCELLRRRGVRADLVDMPESTGSMAPPFLCFQRRTCGDVLVNGFKVVGSAQRRVRGALLQHGSILLDASPAAPEIPGIENLSAVAAPRGEWSAAFVEAIVGAIECQPVEEPLTNVERGLAAAIVEGKFGRAEWNLRR
jgi:lipoyl(octanoyl) transferase